VPGSKHRITLDLQLAAQLHLGWIQLGAIKESFRRFVNFTFSLRLPALFALHV
jgi:hypothetical protein